MILKNFVNVLREVHYDALIKCITTFDFGDGNRVEITINPEEIAARIWDNEEVKNVVFDSTNNCQVITLSLSEDNQMYETYHGYLEDTVLKYYKKGVTKDDCANNKNQHCVCGCNCNDNVCTDELEREALTCLKEFFDLIGLSSFITVEEEEQSPVEKTPASNTDKAAINPAKKTSKYLKKELKRAK